LVRTNIEIDDELVERAMRVYQLSTKRAVVELALQRLVDSMSRAERLAMEGSGWEGDLDELRNGRAEPPTRSNKKSAKKGGRKR
jgi:Arc/MetJ family transcription regulator